VKDRSNQAVIKNFQHRGRRQKYMKSYRYLYIIMILLILVISACQADVPATDELCPIDEPAADCETNSAEDDIGPEAYPVDEIADPETESFLPLVEQAYPITEEDLNHLVKFWRLDRYTEDDSESGPPLKILALEDDGRYTIATETELERGTWTTNLLAGESTLILTPESGDARYYQIVELGEDILNLGYTRENVQITEVYLPDDTACDCD
jgi:hypothetical protein